MTRAQQLTAAFGPPLIACPPETGWLRMWVAKEIADDGEEWMIFSIDDGYTELEVPIPAIEIERANFDVVDYVYETATEARKELLFGEHQLE